MHPTKSIFSLTDLLLITPILVFSAWVYLIPPFQTFGFHTLFSDDAIFAILARNVLEEGPAGAFHLAWGPLLPWLVALLNKIFNIPLEEGARVLTGISLTLRIIPVYLLVKYLFNKTAAFISIYLITIYTFILLPQEGALTEGLFSLIVLTGLLCAFLVLKTEKLRWYLGAGVTGGLAYLARLEGWVFLVALFAVTALRLTEAKNRFLTLKLLSVLVLTFLITASPYLIFIKKSYGSWNLNPRMNIVLVGGGSYFEPYKDHNGVTTLAQVYFSGDRKYYSSNLWHPTSYLFWRSIGRSWAQISVVPTLYVNFLKEQTPFLFFLGIAGLLLTLSKIFLHKYNLLLTTLALTALLFSLLDFSLISLEFLSPVIFNVQGSPYLIINEFFKMILKPDYQNWIIRNTIIMAITVPFLIIKRGSLPKLAHHLYSHKLQIFLPSSFLLLCIPLLFSGFAIKYAIVVGAILAFYSGFFITSLSSLVVKTVTKIHPRLPSLLISAVILILSLAGVFWANRPQFYKTLDTREAQYRKQDFQISWLKAPGLAILKDHGPGAKVGIFYEAPAFYAQGGPFYVMTRGDITLEESLRYLEDNQVDYVVVDKTQAFLIHKTLKPLLLSTTQLPHWKMIYSDPPPEKNPRMTETETDILVTVWKRVD